ncbi:MAG: TssN family type VI secretion system protein [Prolixibacteraceae bacterium]|nr:TssN family type VI secretion system protein [Prolixibacteraceae bacterium]
MKVLIGFFLRYILVPLLVVVMLFVLNNIAKVKSKLAIKKVIVFTLLASLVLAIPALLGLLKNEFVWGGLLLTIIVYLFIGVALQMFFNTKIFKSLGFEDNKLFVFFNIMIVWILSMWIYFFAFEYLSGLPYALWAMTNVSWFLIPLCYVVTSDLYMKIPNSFYTLWRIKKRINYAYWDSLDTFSLIQVTVKIKRDIGSTTYSSFSVKLSPDVPLGEWFDKFIHDQNKRTPKYPIQVSHNDDPVNWIFYTTRWFKIPLFTRVLDPEAHNDINKVKNKQTIYIRRTAIK